jgi:predicted acyl esterase
MPPIGRAQSSLPAGADLGATLRIDQDAEVDLSGGSVMRVNVYRPSKPGKYPAIISATPYGKDVPFREFAPAAYAALLKLYPGVCENGAECKYLRWEAADPAHWVPLGYVVIHADEKGFSRGAGAQNYFDLIEWAARQAWSSGKVGMLGTSALAMNQWQVAPLRPPHLTAMIPWQGMSDFYREGSYHGGILADNFIRKRGGDAAVNALLADPLDDDPHTKPNLAKIEVPLLVGANWLGAGMHERGSLRGFVESGSRQKWLVAHSSITDAFSLYLPKYVALQERFFNHFLKAEDNGWEKQPPVTYEIRNPDGTERDAYARAWPLPGTKWTKFWLDASSKTLEAKEPSAQGTLTYQAIGDGITLMGAPLRHPLMLVGPVAARLWVSSSTQDMDLFVTLRAFAPDGKEVTFPRGDEPRMPLAFGWLRVSMRELDARRSTPYQPWHTFTSKQMLTPGTAYPVDVEVWPTSVRLPKGYRLALTIQGEDFHRDGKRGEGQGAGDLLHNEPRDRPPAIFDGMNTILTGPAHASWLLLPVRTSPGR